MNTPTKAAQVSAQHSAGAVRPNVNLADAAGKLPVAFMRKCFEEAVAGTQFLRDGTPLGIMEINGKFTHYMNAETDTLWLGFALGMRMSERIQKAAIIDRETCAPELLAALEGLKAVCADVLLPAINEAIKSGYKMETWTPEQFQWAKAVADTDAAIAKARA